MRLEKRNKCFRPLSQELGDDLALHIGQPKIAPLVAIGQLFVQQSKAMQNGGVEVVNVNFILDDVEAELIRPSDNLASFDASTRQP